MRGLPELEMENHDRYSDYHLLKRNISSYCVTRRFDYTSSSRNCIPISSSHCFDPICRLDGRLGEDWNPLRPAANKGVLIQSAPTLIRMACEHGLQEAVGCWAKTVKDTPVGGLIGKLTMLPEDKLAVFDQLARLEQSYSELTCDPRLV